MEGVKCSAAGCKVHDFLPFTCSLCANIFCSEHRSRFEHKCIEPKIIDNLSNDEIPPRSSEYSVMVRKIENRFQSEILGSTREHFCVSTSGIKADDSFKRTAEKVNNLRVISNSTRSSKEKIISEKTAQMLIKKRAQ